MKLNIIEAVEDFSAITEKCKTILSKYDITLEEHRYFDLFNIVTKLFFKYIDVKHPDNIKHNALMLTSLFKEAKDIRISGYVKGVGVKKYKIEKGLQELLWLFLNDYVIKACNYNCDYKCSEEHKVYSLEAFICYLEALESNKLNSEVKEYQRNYFSPNLDNKSYVLPDDMLKSLIEYESLRIGKVKSLAGYGDKFIPLYGWAVEQMLAKLPELNGLNKTQRLCLIGDILEANHCFSDDMSETWKLASNDDKMHIIDNCYKSYKNALKKNKKACKGK